MIYFQIIKTNNKNYFFLQMVQDSIFSSYDLISEQNLSSTSFKRSLDNLRKKKKKKERDPFRQRNDSFGNSGPIRGVERAQ